MSNLMLCQSITDNVTSRLEKRMFCNRSENVNQLILAQRESRLRKKEAIECPSVTTRCTWFVMRHYAWMPAEVHAYLAQNRRCGHDARDGTLATKRHFCDRN